MFPALIMCCAKQANDGATVYSVDISSMHVYQRGQVLLSEAMTQEEAVRSSDIVICGVPSKAYKLNPAWIKPGTVIINVCLRGFFL